MHLRQESSNPREIRKLNREGKGYKYPHDFPGNVVEQEYRPPELEGRRYYEPD
jgi:putative ATPase